MRRVSLGLIGVALLLAACSTNGTKPSSGSLSGSASQIAKNNLEQAKSQIGSGYAHDFSNPSVMAWAKAHEGTITAMLDNMPSVAKALSPSELAGMRVKCEALAADVTRAKGFSPIPNSKAQGQWATVLTALVATANDCIDSSSQEISTSLSKIAADEMLVANRLSLLVFGVPYRTGGNTQTTPFGPIG
jgi:hypothetical protein